MSSDIREKLKRSRQRLLDLTLRNRLLNFKAGNPDFQDDLKAHKHLPLKGSMPAVWDSLVEKGNKIQILGLNKEQQYQIFQEANRIKKWSSPQASSESRALERIDNQVWDETAPSVKSVEAQLHKGNLFSLLGDEAFAKRLKRIRQEQNTLSDSTGDSALFLALGFLSWSEAPPSPKAGQQFFAPLILTHVHLDENRSETWGARNYSLEMDLDQAQDNPCLGEKLRQDFGIDLPVLDEDETSTTYLDKVRRAIRTKKGWSVCDSIALGFFNFARYRLWLDLDPSQWPAGKGPENHGIVQAIINGENYDSGKKMPTEEEVAEHQQKHDLPIILDSDSTQYASLLAAMNGTSMVVVGPPGSGKSQTITNLIAVAISEGKRVLFMAQKLAALTVVQKRLEDVGLNPFCLPIFSDKARVTEVHKHLTHSEEKRRDHKSVNTKAYSSGAMAEKLNFHTSKLRETPSGFSESVSTIFRKAVASLLEAQSLWKHQWDDRLLDINMPGGNQLDKWKFRCEQSLLEWRRLKDEVGELWTEWQPHSLLPRDLPRIDKIVKQQAEAARLLREHLSRFPEHYGNISIVQTQALVEVISRSNLFVLEDPISPIIMFLWSSQSNLARVSDLEQKLTEIERLNKKADICLSFNYETVKSVANNAERSIDKLNAVLSPHCSIEVGKEAIGKLSKLINLANDIEVHANQLKDGIASLRTSGHESDQQAPSLKLHHITFISQHKKDAEVHIPAGTNLNLARHVLDDKKKAGEAQLLAERLALYQKTNQDLSQSMSEPGRFIQCADRQESGPDASKMSEKGFGSVRVAELDELTKTFKQILLQIETFQTTVDGVITPQAFGSKFFHFRDIQNFAALATIPPEQLLPPQNEAKMLVSKLGVNENGSNTLSLLADSLDHCKSTLCILRPWFPWVGDKAQQPEPFILELRDTKDNIEFLGLSDQSLDVSGKLLSKTDAVLGKLRASVNQMETLWAKFQQPVPHSLQGLKRSAKLLKVLCHCPFFPKTFKVESITSKEKHSALVSLMGESQSINDFKTMYGSRIAFKDVPQISIISEIRRTLRPLLGHYGNGFPLDIGKPVEMLLSF